MVEEPSRGNNAEEHTATSFPYPWCPVLLPQQLVLWFLSTSAVLLVEERGLVSPFGQPDELAGPSGNSGATSWYAQGRSGAMRTRGDAAAREPSVIDDEGGHP